MANTHDVGDVVRISAVFSQASVAIDPTTVTLVVKPPTGASTTYTYAASEVIKDSTGTYHKDIILTVAGTYLYRWTSTGTGQASEEGLFQVRYRKVA